MSKKFEIPPENFLTLRKLEMQAEAIWSIVLCHIAATAFAAQENFRSAYFLSSENKYLTGKEVKKMDSSSHMSCSRECLKRSWCTSTNYENSSKDCGLNKHKLSNFINDDTKIIDKPRTIFTLLLKVRKL